MSAVEIICSCVDSLLIRGTSGIMAVDFDIVLEQQLLVVSQQVEDIRSNNYKIIMFQPFSFH